MVVRCIQIKVMAGQNKSRVDTSLLKLQMERKIGRERAQKYFNLLNRFLSLKLTKLDFNRQCLVVLGKDKIHLHNVFIRSIIKNASIGKIPQPIEKKPGGPLEAKVPNGYQRSNLQSLCRDVLPYPSRKERTHSTRVRKLRDRPSPLGPNGKTPFVVCDESGPRRQEQQSATELVSLGSKPPREGNSVEEGEEVEQASGSPSLYSKIPIRAPLGISINGNEPRKLLRNGLPSSSPVGRCLNTGELPDSSSLRSRLELKLETERLKISSDCVHFLNSSLDVYLKRLILPCVQLAGSRTKDKYPTELHGQVMLGFNGLKSIEYVREASLPIFASLLDFRIAMESNPRRLGGDWPEQLEKVYMRASDQE